MSRGTSTRGDIVTTTADGRPLDLLWQEFQAGIALRNEDRSALAAVLSRPVTVAAEDVAQVVTRDEFEPASEFGVPVGLRVQPDVVSMGATFGWFDAASRYTWQFLADAPAAQVEAVHQLALEADNRLVFKAIAGALFNNARRTNEVGATVYPLWAGAADDTPPEYMGNTFAAGHTHYLTTGGAFEATDLESTVRHITEHGYGPDAGGRLLIFANSAEADIIRGFRAGQTAGDGSVSRWDFIPGQGAPPYLTTQQIVGDLAPSTFERLPLIGSYGPAWVSEDSSIPAGYVLAVATGGSNSSLNPVSFREHARSEYRGLRLIGGGNSDYPLTDAYYVRGCGTGVRHRGAAAILQVTADVNYTAPAEFAGAA